MVTVRKIFGGDGSTCKFVDFLLDLLEVVGGLAHFPCVMRKILISAEPTPSLTERLIYCVVGVAFVAGTGCGFDGYELTHGNILLLRVNIGFHRLLIYIDLSLKIDKKRFSNENPFLPLRDED